MLTAVSGALLAASGDMDHEDIIERIAPPGTVCLVGEACASGVQVAVAGGGSGPQDPQQIYNTYCTACHTTGEQFACDGKYRSLAASDRKRD